MGLPGSGKSTVAKDLMAHNPGLIYASSDAFLDAYAAQHNVSYEKAFYLKGDEAQKHLNRLVLKCLKEKLDFIWDQTNIVETARQKKIKQLTQAKFEVLGIHLDVDVETVKSRIQKRTAEGGKKIPPKLFENMLTSYTPPTYAEGFKELYRVSALGTSVLVPRSVSASLIEGVEEAVAPNSPASSTGASAM